jgi:hypothetical protein
MVSTHSFAMAACTLVSLGFTAAADAALIDRGGGLIYDSDRDTRASTTASAPPTAP